MKDQIDRLKPFHEIALADQRMTRSLVREIDRAKSTPITFERYYALIAHERLPERVPQKVLQQYETARNLHIYTWYCYRFWPIAVLHTFSALEGGLRVALEKFDRKKRPRLSDMLKQAAKDSRIVSARFRDQSLPMIGMPPGDDPERFTQALVKFVPMIRNEIAHGHQILWPDHLHSLRIVRDCLAQLFDQPKN